MAALDTVVIGATTYRVVQGWFKCRDLAPRILKPISAPVPVYYVFGERGEQSHLDVAGPTGLMPLTGGEQGVTAAGALRTGQGRTGPGVLLSGEAGVGKSRLVQMMKAHVVVRKRYYMLLSGVPRLLPHRLLHRASVNDGARGFYGQRDALTVAEAGRVPGSDPAIAAAIRV